MIFVFVSLFALTSCGDSISTGENITAITSEGVFDLSVCEAKGLSGKALMIESKYCGHCKETLPIFAKACDDTEVNCEILDISEPEQREQMYSYGVEVQFTPTFIINCEYFVGVKTKEEYLSYLEKI